MVYVKVLPIGSTLPHSPRTAGDERNGGKIALEMAVTKNSDQEEVG